MTTDLPPTSTYHLLYGWKSGRSVAKTLGVGPTCSVILGTLLNKFNMAAAAIDGHDHLGLVHF